MHRVRCKIYQTVDISAAFIQNIPFEEFPDLKEQYYRHRFKIITSSVRIQICQQKGSQGCGSHQKILIKELSLFNILIGFDQNVPGNNQIRDQEKQQSYGLRRLQTAADGGGNRSQYDSGNDPEHQFFLFRCHNVNDKRSTGHTGRDQMETVNTVKSRS